MPFRRRPFLTYLSTVYECAQVSVLFTHVSPPLYSPLLSLRSGPPRARALRFWPFIKISLSRDSSLERLLKLDLLLFSPIKIRHHAGLNALLRLVVPNLLLEF